ncbi:MAG: FAD-dependent tricarballylate dehydrogenase TcuA [Alphaproteobacteria bacterium]|jgi:tricarballylate dehydrogenase|nr:FAD-dependent tricarballylate dehydrogenase TcuA [Alphaproteobacteria bacterium]
MVETFETDVVVVGCGISGLAAAVSAQEHGAKVRVLERAPREERGGNTRYTESYWRMKSENEVSDDFTERFAENAGGHLDPEVIKDASGPYEGWPRLLKSLGFADPELVATFAELAGPTLRWLTGFGVKFDFLPNYFIIQSTTRMAPVGGGLALVEALAAHAESVPDDIAIHYETTMTSLLQDEDGRIAGIRAVVEDNRPVEFRAKAVVLASGGFEGNPEMLSHYLGTDALWLRPVARGGYYNRGEGIRTALDLGAAPAGDFGSFHAQPVDPRSGQAEPVVLSYSYGLLVNKRARRFIDEAPGMVDATYEAVTREIMHQPEGIAYAIHDGRMEDVPNWRKAVRSDQPPVEAHSIEALAEALELDPHELAETVEAFNAACAGEAGFDAMKLDGLATAGLEPNKSNWARPLDKPPFLAWPIIAANCFTFGGVKVNARAQVLNMDGEVIPGLYAAGEVMGIYYRTYTGSTSVMRGAVFGRQAGIDAAMRHARANQP